MNKLKVDILPEAAKKELLSFYEYLIFKYLKDRSFAKDTNSEENNHLKAFYRFKSLRDQVNPVVDKSIDIDRLINEVNNDIF